MQAGSPIRGDPLSQAFDDCLLVGADNVETVQHQKGGGCVERGPKQFFAPLQNVVERMLGVNVSNPVPHVMRDMT